MSPEKLGYNSGTGSHEMVYMAVLSPALRSLGVVS